MLKNYRFTLSNTERGHDMHLAGRVQADSLMQAVTKATGFWTFPEPYEDMEINCLSEVLLEAHISNDTDF